MLNHLHYCLVVQKIPTKTKQKKTKNSTRTFANVRNNFNICFFYIHRGEKNQYFERRKQRNVRRKKATMTEQTYIWMILSPLTTFFLRTTHFDVRFCFDFKISFVFLFDCQYTYIYFKRLKFMILQYVFQKREAICKKKCTCNRVLAID